MGKQDLSHLFLQNFIGNLIKNTPFKELPEIQNIEIEIKKPKEQETEIKKPKREYKKSSFEMLPTLEKPIRTKFTRQQLPVLKKPLRKQKIRQQIPQIGITKSSSLSKLQILIKDPSVTEIECKGSGKDILVRKAGKIQRTKTNLTNAEINNIINDFSKITKIPVIGGTFKAAADNLILTAIISEILGPRFILQKRNPFQELTI